VTLQDQAVVAPDLTACACESDVVSVIAELADGKEGVDQIREDVATSGGHIGQLDVARVA
jgi:hypothetical protein